MHACVQMKIKSKSKKKLVNETKLIYNKFTIKIEELQ